MGSELRKDGTCPLYRPKGYMVEEQNRKKQIKKRSWYKPFSTVLFCPPSPGSQLAKELRKVAEEETKGKGWTVKVIERAGAKLAHQVPGLKEPLYITPSFLQSPFPPEMCMKQS